MSAAALTTFVTRSVRDRSRFRRWAAPLATASCRSALRAPLWHCQVPASSDQRLGLEDVPSLGWRVLPYPILISLYFQMSQRLLGLSGPAAPPALRSPRGVGRCVLAHIASLASASSHDAAASNEPSSSSICWMPFIWAPRATVFCNCARRCSSASSSVRTRASRSASAATCASCSA